MDTKFSTRKLCMATIFVVATLIVTLLFSINVSAASKPYEVTKSGGALIRTSYSESSSSVRRAAQGSILWVVSSKKNSAGNTWYKLSDGYWIYSGNVKSHSCSWSLVGASNPSCTASGVQNYKCHKCGQTKQTTSAAYGHSYSGNVCTRCGDWNASSLKSRSSVNNVKYYVTTNGAAVHSGPYGACTTVRTLSKGTEIVVTEKLVNASNNTWYKYSGGYIFEDYVVKHSSCSWNSGTITKKATCTATGTKTQSCTICGKSKTTTLAKLSHSYSSNVCTVCGTWNTASLKSKTSVSNVKYCVVSSTAKVRSGPYEKCSGKAIAKGTDIVVTEKVVNASGNTWYKYSGGYVFADHVKKHSSCSWNSGTITKKATCTATGTKTQSCTICGKSKTTTLAKLSHSYSSNVCTVCGTWNTASLKSKTSVSNVKYCVVSSTAKVRSGPYEKCSGKAIAKGTDIVVTEKVVNASGNTWYKYSGGYVFADHVKKHSSCSWNTGTVTKKATCTATGSKTQSCTVCGKKNTVTVAKAKHSYDDNVCKSCGVWNTASLKSKTSVSNVKYCVVSSTAKVRSGPYEKCSGKAIAKGTDIVVTEKVVNASGNTWYKYSGGYIFSDHVKKHSSCSWNTGTITKKATCTAAGSKTISCTVCGKKKAVAIAKTKHGYADNVCKSCGVWNTASLKSKTKVNMTCCVVSKDAKVRSGPYENCSGKAIAKGTDIVVTEKIVNASGNTWYKCSSGYIYYKHIKNHSTCSWKDSTVIKKATCTTTGSKTQSCTVCGKKKTVTVAKTKHGYVDNVCKTCGVWNTASLKSKTKVNMTCCVVSKDAKVRSGPYENCSGKAIAKGKDIVVTEKIVNASGNTWYKCSSGYIYYKHIKNHSTCMWKDGTVTKKATCTAAGSKTQSCVICGKKRTATIAKIKHSYTDNVCKRCGVWNASSLKSKATVNNVEFCVVSKTAKVHTGPYEKCKTTKTLAKQTVIKVTQKIVNASDNTWYKYSDGYIYGGYVKKHAFTYGMCQSCGTKQTSSAAVAKFNGTISNKTASVAVTFSDKLFLGDSTVFSNSICRISAAGMAASYKEAYGESFLKSCGFTKIEAANSSSSKSTATYGKNDHARYIIGYKKLAGTNTVLVGVLVNGYTTGSYEWVSNFNVGKSGLHKGFSTAANEITSKVNAYIKANKIDTKNMKIWVTGHSRGGAVTGMTAANLNYKYGVQNVFAYGFATPNGVPTSMRNAVPNKTSATVCTDNIFNIVNKGDFVPYVVPESWGFTKYGRTIEMGVGDATKSVYASLAKDTYNGLSIAKREEIIKAFCDYAKNRSDYNKDKNIWGLTPSDFGEAIGLFMCGESDKAIVKVVFGKIGLGLKLNDNKPAITEAHCVEAYLALVNAQSPAKHLPAKSSCTVCNS